MKESTRQTLLNLIANSLFDAGRKIPASIDMELAHEANFQSVQTIAFNALKGGSCSCTDAVGASNDALKASGEAYEAWQDLSNKCLAENVRVFAAHESVHKTLTARGIPYVIIKGVASASYYPSPMDRTMGDVDFLIDKSDLERTQQALEEDGYTYANEGLGKHHHLTYKKDGITAELHFGLNGIPEGDAGARVKRYLVDIINEAKPYGAGGVRVPSDFHHGLVILLHNCQHMRAEGLGLRHLCDWAVFVGRIGDNFPALFETPLKDMGLWEAACIMTAASEKAFGLARQTWRNEYDDAFIDSVIDDIFMMGNLGQKEEDTISKRFIESNNDEIRRMSFGRRVLYTPTRVVRSHWPISKKFHILYPIGYIYFAFKYLFEAIFYKKKLNIKKTLKKARARSEVYDQFHLFEVEE